MFIQKLLIRLKVLVCGNNSSGASSLFRVTYWPGKLFTWIDIAKSVPEQIN